MIMSIRIKTRILATQFILLNLILGQRIIGAQIKGDLDKPHSSVLSLEGYDLTKSPEIKEQHYNTFLSSQEDPSKYTCAKSWHLYKQGCYRWLQVPMSQHSAQLTCQSFGAQLVKIKDKETNDMIGSRAQEYFRKNDSFWTGLMANHDNSSLTSYLAYHYTWADGEPNSEYAGFWDIGEPLLQKGVCVYMKGSSETSEVFPDINGSLLNPSPNFVWSMGPCDGMKPFVCQLPACINGQYQCANAKCIKMDWKCDKEDDCGDNSDEYDCPNQYTYYLEGTSGQIQSPRFPSSYPPNSVCKWVLEGPVGSQIEMHFTTFETENSFDVVEIRGGGRTKITSHVLAEISGDGKTGKGYDRYQLTVDEALHPLASKSGLTYLSPNHFMTLRLTSDGSTQMQGFSAKWTARTDLRNCGSIIYVQPTSQPLFSPNYPESFSSGLECMYKLKAPAGDIISLEVVKMDLKSNDIFNIRDGLTSSDSMLFSSKNLHNNIQMQDHEEVTRLEPPTIPSLIYTTGNDVSLYFFSDLFIPNHLSSSDGSDSLPQGFHINYKLGCSHTLITEYGHLTSPGFGGKNYPLNLTCEWEIISSEGNPITLMLHTADINEDGDYLEIIDGTSAFKNNRKLVYSEEYIHRGTKDDLPAKITGGLDKARRYRSENGRLKIKFYSNEVGSGRGWNITYSIDCPELINPKHVEVFEESLGNGYGAYKMVRCSQNYDFIKPVDDNLKIICLAGGKWNIPLIPRCGPKYCGPVPLIDNGYVVQADKVTYGGVAIYECYQGFHFPNNVPRQLVTCTDRGWSNAPSCLSSTCQAFSKFSYGDINLITGDGLSYGSVLSFSCKSGYRLFGPERAMCTTNGSWDFSNIECRAIKCPRLPKLSNGEYDKDVDILSFGQSVKVKCHRGFQMISANDSITCQSTGNLTETPTCLDMDECSSSLSEKLCDPQGSVCNNVNGSYQCDCTPGYRESNACGTKSSDLGMYNGQIEDFQIQVSNDDEIHTKNYARLNAALSWCGTLEKPSENWIMVDLIIPKIVDHIRIQNGIRMDGSKGFVKYFHIQYTNKKMGELMELTDENGEVLKLRGNSIMDKEDQILIKFREPFEARFIYILIEEYEYAPCMRFELYGCHRTSCIDIDECEENAELCNPLCSNTPGSYKCSCLPGYVLFASNGTMENFLPPGETGLKRTDTMRLNHTCLRILCPKMTHPQNGIMITNVTNNLYYYTESIEFQCDIGFRLKGERYIKCMANGEWNYPVPSCEAIKCRGISVNPSVDGFVVMPTQSDISYGQNVSITCVNPKLEATPTQLLEPNGLTSLMRISLGTAFSTFRQCVFDPFLLSEDNLSLRNNQTRRDLKNSLESLEDEPVDDIYWMSGHQPQCPVIDCGIPNRIAGAEYFFQGNTTIVGTNFLLTCKPPYQLTGSGTKNNDRIYCEENGSWNFGSLICVGPICSDPGTPAGGRQIANSYDEGQMVNFTCKRRGFEPEREISSLKCIVNPACPNVDDLGLTSGLISDQSILVSSALPGYSSNYIRMNAPKAWCGNEYLPSARIDMADAMEPPVIVVAIRARGYVDSSVMGQISSFRFNYSLQPGVYDTRNETPLTQTLNPDSSNSLGDDGSLQFLSHDGGYIMHPEIFTLPQHPVALVRTFVLSKPILARSIVIETLDFHELPCLKLEILGCKERDVYYKLNSSDTEDALISGGSRVVRLRKKRALVGWDRPTPYCVDTEPPIFTNCPIDPIYVPDLVMNDKGESVIRMAHFEKPKAVDNYGIVGYLEAPPFITSPFYMNKPQMEIIYTALDPTGNQASCVINFIIKDNVPPILACPLSYNRDFESQIESLNITFTSDVYGVTDEYLSMTNDTVKALDGLATSIDVQFIPPSAIIPANGYQTVRIVARDKFDNTATCSYHVAVQAQKCAPWSISNITNGEKVCRKLDGKTRCMFQCHEGYRFTDENPDEKIYDCYNDKEWSPHPNVPDCVESSTRMADYQIMINLKYISFREVIHKDCIDVYAEAFKSRFSEIEQQLTSLCSLGKLSVKAMFINAFIAPADTMEITATYHIKLIATNEVYVLLERCTSTISLLTNLAQAPISGLMDMPRGVLNTNYNCPSLETKMLAGVSPRVEHEIKCPNGHIILYDKTVPVCISCSRGMFAATNVSCQPCPLGHYQDKIGQSVCIKCPSSTYTLNPLSKFSTDCLPLCGNGTYSPTGLVPCQVCGHNTYSGTAPASIITECTPCPLDTFTETQGASLATDCKSSCLPGYFSPSGLDKCWPCPINTYQEKSGQISCEECPEESFTVNNATNSSKDCIQIECKKNCMNDGFCKVLYHREVCVCPSGFIGQMCEINIDECSTQPCYNGGSCHDGSNGFSCTCPKGYTGYRCETSPNQCNDVECPPSSMCQSMPDSYKCLCRKGFTGSLCNETINSCIEGLENPCLNGGLCNPAPLDRFTCQCQPGWIGRYCQINIDDCAEKPCLLGAKCIDLHMNFECQCPHGFTGKRCEVKKDLCAAQPGLCNNGTCVDRYFYHECVCPYGFVGKNCEINVNECAFNPCQNGGVCKDLSDNYACECPAGFTGLDCQHNIDDCVSSPCLNNGTCIDGIQNYTCECLPGSIGPHCEIDVDECALSPCDSNGSIKCTDLMGDYVCECRQGYVGHDCDINIDDCITEPCLNGGKCADKVDGYECICPVGWRGYNCESIATFCQKTQCKNGAKCYDIFSDYFCSCEPGYSGKECSSSPNLCAGHPCINGGSCLVLDGAMKCSCPPSYYGKGCEKLRNPCDAYPCQNGGTCNEVIGSSTSPLYINDNEPSSYTCLCSAGFEGNQCQVNIDDCLMRPNEPSKCPDFAKCIDGINSFSCQCPYNSTGPKCDKEVDILWDLYVNGGKSPSGAYQQSPHFLKSHSITIGMWIRFLDYNGKGHFFTLWETISDHSLTTRRELIKIDHMGVYFSFYKGISTQAILFTSTGPRSSLLNDGQWHHLMATANNEPHTSYDVILDGVRLTGNSAPTSDSSPSTSFNTLISVNNRRKNDRFPEYIWLTLGSLGPQDLKQLSADQLMYKKKVGTVNVDMNNDDDKDKSYFRGYISRVNVWDRVLDYDSEIPIQSVNCAKAPIVFDGLMARWADYRMVADSEKIPTNCGNHLCEEGKSDPSLCETLKIDKTIPRIIDCPSDITVATKKRGAQVFWTSVKLIDNKKKVIIESSHESGSYFSIGSHSISILVKDTSGNLDWCHFNIYVNPTNRDCKVTVPSPIPNGKGEETRGNINYEYECGKWGPNSNFAFCSIKCKDPYTTAFSLPVPKFYTCGHEGIWRPNMDEELPVFPTCSTFKRAEKEVRITALFSTKGPCNNAGKLELERRIKREIHTVNERWEMMCGPTSSNSKISCNSNDIDINVICQNEGKRYNKRDTVRDDEFRTYLKKRRQIQDHSSNTTGPLDGSYYLINLSFKSINDPLKNRNDHRISPLKDILMGHFYLSNGMDFETSLPGVSSDKKEFKMIITPRCFHKGQVLIEDKCVNCSLGTYLDIKAKGCHPCPKSTYQDAEGGYGQCKPCPLIKNKPSKTPSLGTSSVENCKESCPPGQYYSLEIGQNGCRDCGYGYYQPNWGAFKCQSCPTSPYIPHALLYDAKDTISAKELLSRQTVSDDSEDSNGAALDQRKISTAHIVSTSTIRTNSTAISDCLVDCESGSQFDLSGTCRRCPKGTYRTRAIDERCKTCPAGFTTPSEGSRLVRECTIPICSPGYFLKSPTNVCMPCPFGYFQPDSEMNSCIACPEDHTTLNEGSIKYSNCLSTNECETGTAKCVANSTCFNSRDNYECICNEGFVGDALINCNDTNECRMGTHSCHAYADCNDTPESYECRCKFGYIGDGYDCNDSCDNYCMNGGNCRKNEFNIQYCECTESFSGLVCADRNRARELKFIVGGISGSVVLLVLVVFIIWMICVKNTAARNQKAKKQKKAKRAAAVANGHSGGTNGKGSSGVMMGDVYANEDNTAVDIYQKSATKNGRSLAAAPYRNGGLGGPTTYPSNQMMIVPMMPQMALAPTTMVVDNTFRRRLPPSNNTLLAPKPDATTTLSSKDDNFLIAPITPSQGLGDLYGTTAGGPGSQAGIGPQAPYYITYPASTRGGIYDYGAAPGHYHGGGGGTILPPNTVMNANTTPGEDDNVYDIYTYQNHAYNPGPPEDYNKLDKRI